MGSGIKLFGVCQHFSQKGAVFGAFAPVSWERCTAQSYIGTGEAFVFKLAPVFQAWSWTHGNSYFMLGKDDGLAVGGGGNFGLWLDAEFDSGTSAPCATFNNDCLASGKSFHCLDVQCFGLLE